MSILSIIICVIITHTHAALPILSSLTGIDQLSVSQGKKKVLLKTGQTIIVPTRIKTDSKTTAVVSYSDGSKSIIAKNTDIEILKPVAGTQWNKLYSGFVRTEVAKPKTAPKKFLFGYKTKTAVMGVRGTVFDIDESVDNKKTELRTLDGDVQIAHNENDLNAGKGQSVKENQFSIVDAGMIAAPLAFNKDDYIHQLMGSQPELVKVSATALSAKALEILTPLQIHAPAVTVPPVTIPPVTVPPAPQVPAKPKLPF